MACVSNEVERAWELVNITYYCKSMWVPEWAVKTLLLYKRSVLGIHKTVRTGLLIWIDTAAYIFRLGVSLWGLSRGASALQNLLLCHHPEVILLSTKSGVLYSTLVVHESGTQHGVIAYLCQQYRGDEQVELHEI